MLQVCVTLCVGDWELLRDRVREAVNEAESVTLPVCVCEPEPVPDAVPVAVGDAACEADDVPVPVFEPDAVTSWEPEGLCDGDAVREVVTVGLGLSVLEGVAVGDGLCVVVGVPVSDTVAETLALCVMLAV